MPQIYGSRNYFTVTATAIVNYRLAAICRKSIDTDFRAADNPQISMDLQEFENAKKKITDFLRGFEGPAPLSQISRHVACPQKSAIFVIAEMISEGVIRENNPDMTYLRLTGETITYSLV